MDAAMHIFARDGFKAASVHEITKIAGVANGTFYTHFRDREEIAAAVAYALLNQMEFQTNAAMVDIEDARLRTSMATRLFIDMALSHPDWGGALIRAIWYFSAFRGAVTQYLRADLELGTSQGVFLIELDELVIDSFVSMAMAAVFGRLMGTLDASAGPRVAELQLIMLGVVPPLAREIAWRDLPHVGLDLGILPAP